MITNPTKFSPVSINLSGKNILIIDDYQEMRTILRDMLRALGADVKKMHMVATGEDAIAILKKVEFDVVLCDLVLGTGKSGQQVLEEAKYLSLVGPSCLWIMISAEKAAESVSGTAEYQPDAYLIKPVTEVSLCTRLEKIWLKKKAFAEIHQAIKRSDYSEALNLCDQRLASDKTNMSDLLRTKCNLLWITGELDRAQDLLKDILSKRELPWAKVALARIFFKKNDFKLVKTLLEETIAVNATYIETHDLLAQTLQVMDDLAGAGDVLERAVKLSPNSAMRQQTLGSLSLKIGKLENAERAFRKSIALSENSVLKKADTYLGLVKVCSARNNSDEAMKVLGQLTKNFNGDDVRLRVLAATGLVHHQRGEAEKAAQLAIELDQSLSKKDERSLTSEESLEIAHLLLVAGDKEKAICLLQSEIKNNPESPMLHKVVADIFEQAGMREEGNRLIEATRQEAILMMNRGVLLVSKGQYEEAVCAMREARAAMPTNVRVLLNLAHVFIAYIQKKGSVPGLIDEARNSLLAANELSPGEPRFKRLMTTLNELV
ncbi:response regulator [Nitrosomonas sp.]|uniref:response regulator n=1 Tax=Nitrosomonas sp. TaxID=42353 RepID=UPI001DFD5A13|nr:response regulator [Nitrosomonas sp.]MBX3617373.1 response regulator [Nitrosomonas sp.]